MWSSFTFAVIVVFMVTTTSQAFAYRDQRVGHTTVEIVLTGSLGERRPIDVELWYPARKKNFDEAPMATYQSRLHGVPLIPERWDPLAWQITSTVAREGVEIKKKSHGYPVVIFSHGSVNNPIDYYVTLEELAANGYVVAAPWHTGNNQDDQRTNFMNNQAGFALLKCLDGLPAPCLDINPQVVGINRMNDVVAILDTLPSLFGSSVNMDRVGIMGHSAGSATGFVAAGGSTPWGIVPDARVDAVLGMAMISDDIIDQMNLPAVTVPSLLVAAEFDVSTPPARSLRVFNGIASTEKAYVLLSNAVHRSFTSGMCNEMQASAAVVQANPTRAVLDRQTLTGLITNANGSTLDYCGYQSFTSPVDIRPIVSTLNPFVVTETSVPRLGVTSAEVNGLVSKLAVDFFKATLECKDVKDYLADDFLNEYDALISLSQRQADPVLCDRHHGPDGDDDDRDEEVDFDEDAHGDEGEDHD
jgi:predicted dienelactone hydrolase